MIKRNLLTIIILSLFLGSSVYSMEQDANINFKTADGKIVSCPRELCFFSTVIKNVIEDIPGGEESDDFIPLPNIKRRNWDLLYPLLKFIRDDKVQEIRDSLHAQYELRDLVKLLHASNYLDVKKTVGDKDEIVLLELVAEAIAVRLLSTEQNLDNFIANQKFLESLNLDRQQLPCELSNMLAQKVIARKPGCRARLLQYCPVPQKALSGHTDPVISAAFLQSGDKIVTVSNDFETNSFDTIIRIWDAENYNCLHTLREHAIVTSATFNQVEDTIATVSDETVQIWNVKTGKCSHVLQHYAFVNSAAFNQSGDKVVTVSEDETARIWDTKNGKCLHVLRHDAPVISAAFNQLGNKVITASEDRTAQIWDTKNGKCLHVLRHDAPVTSAVFNQSGDKVVTASWDRTARIWDLNILLSCEQGLKGMTLEQALLLLCWNVVQSESYCLDLRDNTYLQSIFESIGDENIKNIVKSNLIFRQ